MVSLSRLLAAAQDTPPEQRAAAPHPPPPIRDCVLPSVVPLDAIPARLLAAVRPPSESPGTPADSRPVRAAPSRPSRLPPLPLQRLLGDLGPAATHPANMASLARTLAHFGRPSEAAVASALLFLTTSPPPEPGPVDSHTMFHLFALFCADPENPSLDPAVQRAVATANPSSSEWRPDVLIQAVITVAAQFNAPLDWRLVVRSLDVAGLEKQLTQPAFVEIAKAYMAGSNGSLLPADCILDSWMHRAAQLCIISHALASPEYIDWDTLEVFDGATQEDATSPYSRVALIEKLVELNALDLLKFVLSENSDLVLLSLTCSNPRNNTNVQQKLTVSLLNPLIAGFPKGDKTLRQMWNVAPDLVESAIRSQWKSDPAMLRVAFVIAVDLGILQDLLSSGTSIEFSIELAMMAYREEMLDLENWLSETLSSRGVAAVLAIALHLSEKARLVGPNSAAQFSLNAVRIVLRCLLAWVGDTSAPVSHEAVDAVQEAHQNLTHLNSCMWDLKASFDLGDRKVLLSSGVPESAPLSNGAQQEIAHPPEADTGESISEAAVTATVLCMSAPLPSVTGPVSFPGEIERAASYFFEDLYKSQTPTENSVEKLRRLKESSSEDDGRLFYCMMYSLFDEYRFFKKYPERELEMTGRLFGSIVQEGLLPSELQGLALKVVLDSLKAIEPHPSPPGRLAFFGLFALERFVARLPEWPHFCSEVLKVARLAEVRPLVISEVKRSLDLYRGPVPSPSEMQFGLTSPKAATGAEGEVSTDGAAPPAAVRDPSADADAVSQLIASPPPPVATTPMRDPASVNTGLRPSPSVSMDGSLVVSPANLTLMLGMTMEEAEQVIPPDDSVQDKIKFIFNNLSQATMDDKVQEMLEILDAQYHRYFSVYVVVKRASSESNFHHLYIALLERMAPSAPALFPMIFDTSYRRARVLLMSEKILSTPTERVTLKSLGSWIGALTLARNQPILKRDLDLKELLMDAYSRGRLIAVVPFVSKVLEASQRSRIFKTTNPWIRGLLSVMKEIYCLADLKLNMKFELQLLCKSLNIDVHEVTSADLLGGRPAPDKANNPDFNTKKPANASPIRSSPSPVTSPSPELRRAYAQAGASGRSGIPMFSLADPQASAPTLSPLPVSVGPSTAAGRMDASASLMGNNLAMGQDSIGDLSNMLANASIAAGNMSANPIPRGSLHSASGITGGGLQPSGPAQRQAGTLPTESTLIPNLGQYITISPTLILFQTNPNLKRILPIAIDRAIREIIQPVVERSCAIAFLTTKELTLKDFANEPDTGKVRRAALQMVQQLAGSLALVTSKEPLRVSMGNQLRSILSPVAADQTLVEQTSQVICAANLEIGCAVIERHAKEKAARDLNEKIAPAFSTRRPQHSSYSLGPAPGPEVLRVYDEFSRIPRAGTVPSQYVNVQHNAAPVSQPSRQTPPLNAVAQPGAFSGAPIRPSNGSLQQVYDHRTNGTATTDPAPVEGRSGTSHVSSRAANTGIVQNEIVAPVVPMGRRSVHTSTPQVESRGASSLYGNVPTIMASAANLSTALLAAAGSSSDAGQGAAGAQSMGANASSTPGEEALSTQQVLERFNAIYPRLTALLTSIRAQAPDGDVTLSDVPADHELHSLWIQIPASVKRSVTADEAGMAVAQKVFKGLYEGEDFSLNREIHVLLLEGLRESCRRLSKELVSWLAYSEEHKKLHRECIVALLKPGSLLNITNYDELLSKTIDNGRNLNALDFACFLVHRAVIEEPLATAAELYLTLEAMAKVGRRSSPPSLPSAPAGLLALVDASRKVVHQPAAPVSSSSSNTEVHHPQAVRQAKEAEPADPPGTRESVANCLAEWQRILVADLPNRPVPEQMASQFLSHVRTNFINSDDARERFFRVAMDLICGVTSAALRSPRSGAPGDLAGAPYSAIDSTVRLLGALCRSEPDGSAEGIPKGVHMLSQFLIAVVKDILKTATGSDVRPQFRVLSMIIQELAIGVPSPDVSSGRDTSMEATPAVSANDWVLPELRGKAHALHFLDDKSDGFLHVVSSFQSNSSQERCTIANMQVLTALVCALIACSPAIVPGFAFSWLQLMSNKEVLPRLLQARGVRGGNMFLHLLVSMLSFMSTYLRDPHPAFTDGVRVLYKGTLRVLLVLLHDFPEFLCDYHMAVVDVIPHNCVQLRNIVLASFPKSMRLPDPFLPELKIEELPEMTSQPRVLTMYTQHLEASGLKTVVDLFLHNSNSRRGMSPPRLLSYITATDSTGSEGRYRVPIIGAMVLYVGQYAISQMLPGTRPVMENPVTDLVESLSRELDPEGQYHLFNAIANQLRYPNCHTLYYNRLILSLFQNSSADSVKEQITRVLLERLIANRPHPWGLLVTFVELVKNTSYNFWGHDFVRCAPEIQELFENVAKVCIGPTFQNQQRRSLAAAS